MAKDFDHIRAEARAYGKECNAADRAVNMGDFCDRMGKNRQWLSSGHSKNADDARAVVLEEWAKLGVKAHNILKAAIAEVGGSNYADPGLVIPESDWPHYTDLTRILAHGNRREMFTDLRNRYGREVAMRYACVCDRKSVSGARQGKNSFDVAVEA